jgi:hypothetical protein
VHLGPAFLASILTVVLIGLALTLPVEFVRAWLALFYALQLTGLIVLFGTATRWDPRSFVKPSMVSIIYIGLSMVLGALSYSAAYVIVRRTFYLYKSWPYVGETFAIVASSLLAIFFVACFQPRTGAVEHRVQRVPGQTAYIALLFGLLLITMPFAHPLLPPARTVAACGILVLLFRSDHSWKWVLSLALMGLLAAISAGDKRHAIFLLASLALAYACYPGGSRSARLSGPQVTALLVGVLGLTFWLVTAMSIMRGYAGYQVDNIFTAITLVPEYLSHPYAIGMLSLNFEVGYVFFHLHNAVNSAIQYADVRMGGESFAKVFFFGIPESVFGFKPSSIIESYTRYYDQGFRQIGGSLGVTIIGEAAWNFGYFAAPILVVIYAVLDRIFFSLRALQHGGVYGAAMFLVYLQYTLLAARGGGLDMLLAYCVLAAIFGAVILLPMDLLSRSSRGPAPSRSAAPMSGRLGAERG